MVWIMAKAVISFSDMKKCKQMNRDALVYAIYNSPADQLEEASSRLRDAMRKPEGERRRERIGPPAFAR